MEKKSIGAGKIIYRYLVFLIAVAALLLLAVIPAFLLGNNKTGLLAVGIFAVYVIAAVIFLIITNKRLSKHLTDFVKDYALIENRMIEQYPVPYAIADRDGRIILYNERFSRFYDPTTEGICDIFKEVNERDIFFEGDETDISVVYDKRNYRLHLSKISLEGVFTSGKIARIPDDHKYILALHMIDETEVINMMHKLNDSRAVVCSIRIDDYEEMLDRVDEINRSIVSALIDKEISSYFGQVGGLVRTLDRNMFFVVFERRYLAGMQRNKFDILDNIRSIDTENDFPVTVSIGIGVGEDYTKSQDYAKNALDLALGRGGDQVVVKEGERVYFYGGKVKSVEKNTRVKARMTALALRDILRSHERVVIMGHKTADTDCFGASIGMYKAAQALGRKAYIVLNELENSVQPILEDFLDHTDYGEKVFVPVEKAPQYVDSKTVLVIVDVNRPQIFECPELVDKAKTIIMIDHHLQSGDRVDNVALSYVEPSASSATEMITELLQYITGDLKLSKLEAEALYAGILIDTDSFTKNTGDKTFEAAALLRKSGVDISRTHDMFSDSLETYKLKAQAFETVEMFEPGFALAVSPSEGTDNPTVLAAQVANQLLGLSSVRASFVLVKVGGKVSISARSKSDVNVQIIMERMGGGGHSNLAGAQLTGCTIEEAAKKVRQTVRKMIEDGILELPSK